jgi:hypothetical protein
MNPTYCKNCYTQKNIINTASSIARNYGEIPIYQLRGTLPVSTNLDACRPNVEGLALVRPEDSIVRTRIPLSDRSFPERLKYRNFDDGVRPGRILEDFDSVAVAASYKHNKQLVSPLFYGILPLNITDPYLEKIFFILIKNLLTCLN